MQLWSLITRPIRLARKRAGPPFRRSFCAFRYACTKRSPPLRPLWAALYAFVEQWSNMKVSVGKLSAWFAIIGTIGIFSFIPWLIYKSITNNSSYDYLLFFSIVVGLLFTVIHYILALFVKCPKCGNLLMIKGFKKTKSDIHDNGLEVAFLWFTNKVHCMHCGIKLDDNGI